MEPRNEMRAVIAHCWTGTPEAGWYPAVGEQLRNLGFRVDIPALPAPDTPEPSAWLEAITQAVVTPDRDLLLIGHSLGALAALHWLAMTPSHTRIAGLFLVAPPLSQTGLPEVDQFLAPAPDLAEACNRVARAAVLVSDADKYLLPTPAAIAQRMERIGFESLVAPGKGHFSPASGLKELPEVAAWAARLLTGKQ